MWSLLAILPLIAIVVIFAIKQGRHKNRAKSAKNGMSVKRKASTATVKPISIENKVWISRKKFHGRFLKIKVIWGHLIFRRFTVSFISGIMILSRLKSLVARADDDLIWTYPTRRLSGRPRTLGHRWTEGINDRN